MDHAIARAARELLVERGYSGFTVDAVAAKAGVGKAAIYRRYSTKQELIFSVAVHGMDEQPPPDTGSLATDLAAVSRAFAAQLGRASVDVLVGLLADIYGDSAVGDRFAETFLVHERFMVAEVLDRAVARGELKRLPDLTAVQALLFGPVFAWLLILEGDPGRSAELAETAAVAVAARLRDGTRM